MGRLPRRRGSLHLGLFFALVALVGWPAGAEARLRVGVVEISDPYTEVKGLATLVRRAGHRPVNVTGKVRRGTLPWKKLDALVIGSFACADERIRDGLARQEAALGAWIAAGHTLVVLAQEGRDIGEATWLPDGLTLAWGDVDSAGLVPLAPGHPWLSEPHAFPPAELLGWSFAPKGGDRSVLLTGVHDAFRTVVGFEVVATADTGHRHPALVVGAHGGGRVVGLAVPVDKLAHTPRDKAHARAAGRLLANVLTQATRREPVVPTAPVRHVPQTRTVTVFEDRDGDGRRGAGEPPLPGVLVGHGLARYRTNEAGEAAVPIDPAAPHWLHVQAPSRWRVQDGRFYRRDTETPLAFALVPRDEVPDAFTVAHVTDWHVGLRRIAPAAVERLVQGLAHASPAVDLVLATGDLTQKGTPEEIAAYVALTKDAPLPVLDAMGNHDASRGPERGRFYREQIGPVFYGYEHGGVHFTVAYVSDTRSPEMDWIRADLTESGLPTVLVLHHLPRTGFLRAVAGPSLIAIVHGHWHGNRMFRFGSVPVVSTSSAFMGGWDHSPASFRLLHFAGGRLTGGALRYTAPDRSQSIVVPGAETAESSRRIIVHALDAFRPPERGTAALRDGAGGLVRRTRLTPAGEGTWSAELSDLPAGDYELTVQMADGTGEWPEMRRPVRFAPARPGAPPSGRWPTYRADLRRSGAVRAPLRPPLHLRWVAALQGAVHHASPVVDEARVYVALEDRDGLRDGSPASGVCALDRRTGESLWGYRTRSSVRHSPTLHGDTILFQEEDGTVTALDVATGHRRWSFSLEEASPPRYGSHWASCAPLVHRGMLVACYHRYPVVLDAEDGRLLATLKPQGREDAFTLSAAVFHRGSLFHGGLFSGLSGYRLRSGGRVDRSWHLRGLGLYATPTVGSSGLWVQDVAAVQRRDAGSGAELGVLSLKGGRSPAPPLVVGGDIVAVDRRGALVRWNPVADKRRWSLRTGAALLVQSVNAPPGVPSVSSAPVLVGGQTVWFGADDGKLRAVEVTRGKVLWERDLGLPVTGGPVVAGRDLYVVDLAGVLYAFQSE